MRVVIVGAGDVGTYIAEDLAESHEIAVVDTDGERVAELESTLGVTAIEGDGRSLDALEAAGIDEAEIVIASTDDDAVNVMVCGAVRNSTDAYTIARAKSADLYETWETFDDALGIDLLLPVDRLTAAALVRTVALPGALAVSTFVDGEVEMAEFELAADADLVGKSVAEADEFPSLTFAGVIRDGTVHIPSGETVFAADDRVVVIGSPSSVRRFARRLTPGASLDPDDDVVIVGGGTVGTRIARLLEQGGYTPRLVEHDPERVAVLDEELPETTVIEGDVTTAGFLTEASIDEADLLVGTLDDETNYVLALLAKNVGAGHTAAVVNDSEYVDLFEAAGVDVTVEPRAVVANETTRATQDYADEAATLERDSAEVLEITVDGDSVLAGESIVDVAHDLPDGFVVGAVVRDGSLKTPRGGTVVQVGDHVVAFVDTDALDEVAAAL
ncbi:Trk system potassium transporter TrkA [Halococcus dombrowskii]|uniref:Trk system potassium transporter TrkA n=1 Tax=Halococcus dombrowskii TaxID=179637 RepID=A0AAV3SE18_HALDO|nr:Trk system potassium transporter TrkA [Halococcus dombrowskii]UOO96132.1 Trk system potassium transporter TrkA [Halococcus dombrowskii]